MERFFKIFFYVVLRPEPADSEKMKQEGMRSLDESLEPVWYGGKSNPEVLQSHKNLKSL